MINPDIIEAKTHAPYSGLDSDKIASLSENELWEIYKVASRLFSEDEQKKISFSKSRASYLIGVIENILDQQEQ